jgi:hypothetical protein
LEKYKNGLDNEKKQRINEVNEKEREKIQATQVRAVPVALPWARSLAIGAVGSLGWGVLRYMYGVLVVWAISPYTPFS